MEAIESVTHPDDKHIVRAAYTDTNLNLNSFEYRIICSDQSIRHILANNSNEIFDDFHNLVYIVGTAQDITEQKTIQMELIEAKKQAEAANVAKSQFLANMSHEIRTPLNSILGFLNLLSNSSLSSEQKDYIHEAKKASEILLYLINDILDLSKIEAGKITIENTCFQIRTVVEDAANALMPTAIQKNLELHTLIKHNVPEEVIGDPARIKQILNNLISNAIKFTETGEVNITVECTDMIDGKAYISFEVKDTGIGISEENLNKLFKPFTQADASTTRKYGGTGLGLVISKELIKLMHGDISVISAEGKGSTFRFNILVEVSDGRRTVSEVLNEFVNEVDEGKRSVNLDTELTTWRNDKATRENFQPRILLVEDNEMNRKIVITVLKQRNMFCDIATDGTEAIKALQDKNYDIVFMDCQMPIMDGYECTARIRKMEGNKKHTIIIAMTANAMAGDKAKCLEAGMDNYLSKPIDFNTMFRMVETYIHIKPSELEIKQNNIIENNIDKFLLSTGLDEASAQEIYKEFIQRLPNQVQDIKSAIANNDFEKVSRLAHQLKGSSANLWIDSISQLAMALENSAIDMDTVKGRRLFMELENLVDNIK
jgi:signal transduction histidine kinase/CheY-like chemotaxis protein